MVSYKKADAGIFSTWQYDIIINGKVLLKDKIESYRAYGIKWNCFTWNFSDRQHGKGRRANALRRRTGMEELLGISLEWIILIGVNFLLILILFLMNLSNRSKIKKLKYKYNKFMNGLSDVNIESVLDNCINNVDGVIEKNKELEYKLNTVERNMYYCVQKVGVVRYNAFDNVGSDLSYSIALLNNNDDGLVISSLYTRDSSSTYAKPIVGGKSRYALSAEELQAIDTAKKTHISNKYTE